MSNKLDQLVKGAPPPHLSQPSVPVSNTPQKSTDPTSLLPSSPPQIYLNLLILEASLRSQYLSLLSRRRQNQLVLLLLGAYIGYTTYLVFLRLREDGTGVGGSPYWLIDRFQKISWLGGIIMLVLFRVTGQWERGIRWPRRWLGATNRGLRRFNCKAVILKRPWWRETISLFAFLLPLSLVFPTPGSNFHNVESMYTREEKVRVRQQQLLRNSEKDGMEEDLAPGGDVLKLILLPKPFSANFREEWEVFRARYWEAENSRRKALLTRVNAKEREMAKKEGGWLWWTGWRGWARFRQTPGPKDSEKGHAAHLHHDHVRTGSVSNRRPVSRRESLLKERMERSGSHSRSSSRSSVSITPELEERGGRLGERERRLSSSSTASDRRKRRPLPTVTGSREGREGLRSSSRLSQQSIKSEGSADGGSRPGTPKDATVL